MKSEVFVLKKITRLFTKHYAIERFGVLFLVVFSLMVVNLSTIVVRKVNHDKQELSGKAVYTKSFAMSKTETAGTVEGLFTNQKQDECFLLLKFSTMSDIPIDAESYQMFLTGSTPNGNGSEIKCRPSAMLYVFGNTGYIGVYLQNSEKFPSQVLDLVLRSKSDFKGKKASANSSSSFDQFNQARIYFNPGGSYAQKAEFMEKPDWSVFDLFEEIVSRPQEAEIRSTLKSDLSKMQSEQLLMEEYGDRLSGSDMGLLEPKAPSDISDDVIYAMDPRDEGDEHMSWDRSANAWYSKLHKGTITEDYLDLYLDTDFLAPGGYDFEWQTGSVKDGYLADLTGSDDPKDWEAYFSQHAADAKSREATFDASDVVFQYADGTEYKVDGSSGSDDKKDGQIREAIHTLQQSWSAYYDLKTKYQCEDLPALLRIEADAYTAQESYTVNTDKDGSLLVIY